MPNLYLIGGVNCSGKTTVALRLLLNFLEVFEYVNADEIAVVLSPLKPESVAIQLVAECPLNQQPIIYKPNIWSQITER